MNFQLLGDMWINKVILLIIPVLMSSMNSGLVAKSAMLIKQERDWCQIFFQSHSPFSSGPCAPMMEPTHKRTGSGSILAYFKINTGNKNS